MAELVLSFEVQKAVIEASISGDSQSWLPALPFQEARFREQLEFFRRQGLRPLPVDDQDQPTNDSKVRLAELRGAAVDIGEGLASMLSEEAQKILARESAASDNTEPLLLRLKVGVAPGASSNQADELLALPWELLLVNERFPVNDQRIDLVREAVGAGLALPSIPRDPLKVVAIAAAPVELTPVDHEGEMYRLWQALGARDEGLLRVSEQGTLASLLAQVTQERPSAVHFTGHGAPGGVMFEDDAARGNLVAAASLVEAFSELPVGLPRLFFLSSCSGFNTPASGPAASASTAAALHRAGFAQVVGYFGSVGDDQATRLAARFYGLLARGAKAREALRQARALATTPIVVRGLRCRYPFGWAQLALYHRGDDLPTAIPAADLANPSQTRPFIDFERLDRAGDSQRVEHVHQAPLVGVQQLRHGFIGRRGPRAQALRAWQNGQRMLVVVGLGGLGKTALCAELLRLLPGRRALALDGRHAGAQSDPLIALWQEVQQARSGNDWFTLLAELQVDGLTAKALALAIAALCLAEKELIVYLDDAESLLDSPAPEQELGRWKNESLRELWAALAVLSRENPNFGLLASSRYRPENTPEAALIHLPALSSWETIRLLAWLPTLGSMPHADRQWLADRVAGHPRTLEWLEALAAKTKKVEGNPAEGATRAALAPLLDQAAQHIDADLLLPRIWEMLDLASRNHLACLCVLTAAAPWGAIASQETSPGTGRDLVDAGLLSPVHGTDGAAWWAPHRLVVAMVDQRWDGDRLLAHRRFGRWYRDQIGDDPFDLYAQRAIQHLCAAGDGEAAAPLAFDLIFNFRDAGRFVEGAYWAALLLTSHLTGQTLGRALAMQAHLRIVAGKPTVEGEKALLEALEILPASDRPQVLADLGTHFLIRSDLGKAGDYFRRAEAACRSAQLEEGRVAANIYQGLATVLHESGDPVAAKQYSEMALKILVAEDPGHSALPEVLRTQAFILLSLGEYKNAIGLLEGVLEKQISHFRTEKHQQVAGTLEIFGGALMHIGDFRNAVFRLRRSLEIQDEMNRGEPTAMEAATRFSLAQARIQLGELDLAEQDLARVRRIQEAVFGTEIHLGVALTYTAMSQIFQQRGELDAAQGFLEKSLGIQREVFATEFHPQVAQTLHELATLKTQLGDLRGARQLLEQVMEIEAHVFQSREHPGTIVTEKLLAFVLVQLGEAQKGFAHLRHAYEVCRATFGPADPRTQELSRLLR